MDICNSSHCTSSVIVTIWTFSCLHCIFLIKKWPEIKVKVNLILFCIYTVYIYILAPSLAPLLGCNPIIFWTQRLHVQRFPVLIFLLLSMAANEVQLEIQPQSPVQFCMLLLKNAMSLSTEHLSGCVRHSNSAWTISSIDALAKAVFLWSPKDLRHDTWVSVERHLLCDRSWSVSLLSSPTPPMIETPTHANTPPSPVSIGITALLRSGAEQGLVEEIDVSLI